MLEKFISSLGVTFSDKDLLRQALTHRSYLNENRSHKLDHNERLEFLGDAVLELVVTEYLYYNFSNPEGELTSWRAALVNGDMLATVAHEISIEDHLLMSKGEAKDTGRARQYILANAMEAIIGALYLDQGYVASAEFITRVLIDAHLQEVFDKKLFLDPKSHFQECAQEKVGVTPHYKVLSEEGPDHDRRFVVGAFLGDEVVAKGGGWSKQDAQREAARLALENKKWL
ncbi:MAG: ribonuclease III [Candidatus Moranbacteria bacterium]|nr:ribonuclease III [Candidatus Moranbacteria bacterium]